MGEKPDCVGPRDLETMRVDHAEAQLRIGDGVRERTAAERDERSGARCEAELRDHVDRYFGLASPVAPAAQHFHGVRQFEKRMAFRMTGHAD